MRHTKIVCTLGPSSRTADVVRGMVEAGMDVARINLSHGTHEGHREVMRLVRRLAEEAGRPVGIMADLQGPRVRVGEIRGGEVSLAEGGSYTFTAREVVGDARAAAVSHAGLPIDVKPGDRIHIEQGGLLFEVESVEDQDIRCRILAGGILRSRKGMNLPGVDIGLPPITAKDREDLAFALGGEGADFVAMSFVGGGKDVHMLRDALREKGADVPVIAKIERRRALDDLAGVIEEADAVMVARGDLAMETSMEEVPVAQKRIIRACRLAGKPVITATQMLESMTRSPEPTRAEAADVANAVFDGSDALLLSGETAVGRHPVAVTRAMAGIVLRAERAVREGEVHGPRPPQPLQGDVDDTIASLAPPAAENVGAKAILAFTRSGSTALRLARQRPWAPVVAVTPTAAVARRMTIVWGVRSVVCAPAETRDALVRAAMDAALGQGFVAKGDTVVLVAGLPGEAPGHTNLLEIRRVE